MGTIEASPKSEKADELRTAYNSAFSTWVMEVSLLQACAADPAVSVDRIRMAKERTQQAERAYRERRNLLLRRMSARVV